MKMKISKTIALVFIMRFASLACFAQRNSDTDSLNIKKHEMSVDFGAFYSPIISRDFYGINFEAKYFLSEKFETGLCYSLAGKKISDKFSYSIGTTIIDYYEYGWINQYEFVKKEKIRIGLSLNNGLLISRLGDNDEKERYWTKTGGGYMAKAIAYNYLYIIEPGIDISFRVYSNKNDPYVFITTKSKYRFAIGETKFGQTDNYTNYYIGLGVTVNGIVDFKK